MNVSITFRHMDASEAIKKHAAAKLGKLQKFLRQPMTAKVTISVDKLKHVAEARISAGGEHLEAKESSNDMYSSIDRMIEKLEAQVRGHKGAAESRRRTAKKAASKEGDAEAVEEVEVVKPAKKKAKAAPRPAKKVAKKSKR
ncbi:MAG TPA: ribosome-associated translation inhibitor RaiA [Polyangiaceae bacterium]|nr:ribosome-associated translation inhibitor RaiA [Polyangiaceae bacterium]